jgi:hypothetical protein
MATYLVNNQWGGESAPWHEAGKWVIGAREQQSVVAIDIKSSDDGRSLIGQMTYAGEGPIGFQATSAAGNNEYIVQNQWGGESAPWHEGGKWVIGDRATQKVIALSLNSQDNGKTLNGTMQYSGEGPIGFKGVLVESESSQGRLLTMSLIRGVLLSGKFRTKNELDQMSDEDQRNTLIVELSNHTNQSIEYFQGMDDTTLAGSGGVMVFLRENKIRDDASLKTMSNDDQRNTLIVEIGNRTNLGSYLQSLKNNDLVALAGLCMTNWSQRTEQLPNGDEAEQKYDNWDGIRKLFHV